MYVVNLKITYDPPPSKYSRKFNATTKAAYLAGAKYWHQQFLPMHFRAGAESKYHYRTRTEKYLNRKGKRGKPPLVYSGATQEAVESYVKIKPYPSRVRLEMHAPRYVKMVPRSAKHPNLGREIAETTPAEVAQIAAVMTKAAEKEMNKVRGRATIKIG